MRLAAVLVFVGVVCGALYFVVSHPAQDRLEELERELEALRTQNEELAQDNEVLERQIIALRDDPRVAVRHAREAVGLARPDELIFQFDEPRQPMAVQVRLYVGAEHLELAGRIVEIEELARQLETLSAEIPHARLTMEVDEAVGPIERQRVIDIVEESPLGPGRWSDEG